MDVFRKNHSSNLATAKSAINKMKASGGTANLSKSQIAKLITNLEDAKKFLSGDEFSKVDSLYQHFLEQTSCEAMDLNGYNRVSMEMISQYEQVAPYLLFDGEISKNLQLSMQLKIRGLSNKGIPYDEASKLIKSGSASIEPYNNYDPIGNEPAKQMASSMYERALDYFQNNIQGQEKNKHVCLGFILSLYGTLYRISGKAQQIQEQLIIFYLILFLATDNNSDEDINKVMQYRKKYVIYFFKKANRHKMQKQEIIAELGSLANKFCSGRGLKTVGMVESLNACYSEILSALS